MHTISQYCKCTSSHIIRMRLHLRPRPIEWSAKCINRSMDTFPILSGGSVSYYSTLEVVPLIIKSMMVMCAMKESITVCAHRSANLRTTICMCRENAEIDKVGTVLYCTSPTAEL